MNPSPTSPSADTWSVEFPSFETMTPDEQAAVVAGGPWPIRVVTPPGTVEGQRRHTKVLSACRSWSPPARMLREAIHALADLVLNDLQKFPQGGS